jgi:hypothetical protein
VRCAADYVIIGDVTLEMHSACVCLPFSFLCREKMNEQRMNRLSECKMVAHFQLWQWNHMVCHYSTTF